MEDVCCGREKILRLLTFVASIPVASMPSEPSRRRLPLKFVVRTIRSIEAIAESIWSWFAVISAGDRPPGLEQFAAVASDLGHSLICRSGSDTATIANPHFLTTPSRGRESKATSR